MIIFENKTWQMNPAFPNSDFWSNDSSENEDKPKWIVPDDSPLAEKIISTSNWEAVEDENGNLIDIVPLIAPISEPSQQEKIKRLKVELTKIDNQAIRPLRAIAAGTADEDDREVLITLEQQAKEIRMQLSDIEKTMEVHNEN